jgi:hypothetical protein
MIDFESEPCKECWLAKRCAEEEIACRTFKTYVNKGNWESAKYRVRIPNKHIFAFVFNAEGE